ncbi:cytochrome P450 [Penicillium herquei]|nr:cytochrome P450 [Penicillium herquei]
MMFGRGDVLSYFPPIIPITPLLVTTCFVYLGCLVVYRLWLSPLAKFPGPKLAAATGWYETYFELIPKGGGQFTFHIKELHEKYGPIVRINPRELHIDDPEYYGTLYTSTRVFDKAPHLEHRFGLPLATFSTADRDVHKARRAAIAPFFSKRRIHEQAPMIQSNVDVITHRLKTEYSGTDKVVQLNDVFTSLSADVIMTYAFNRSYKLLHNPDFTSQFTRVLQTLKNGAHFAIQFPFLGSLGWSIPPAVCAFFKSDMESMALFKQDITGRVQEVLDSYMAGHTNDQEGTIFFEMLRTKGSTPETMFLRLRDEGIGVVMAGVETTKTSEMITAFHILDNPTVLSRLQTELQEAIPDPTNPPPLIVLEKLPYLAACVEEGLRISYGATGRSPRISRDQPLQYREWEIPANVMVGMDSYHMHRAEDVFPDSHTFIPERWLDSPTGPTGEKSLSQYFTTFGRGTRMCVGFSLAYATITLSLASLFRNFDLELYETSRRDVDLYRDMLGVDAAPGSKGVRVKVKGCRS